MMKNPEIQNLSEGANGGLGEANGDLGLKTPAARGKNVWGKSP